MLYTINVLVFTLVVCMVIGISMEFQYLAAKILCSLAGSLLTFWVYAGTIGE